MENTGEYEVIGTPRAMSPEQIEARPIDGRSDLFSLGILMYELLSAITPFGTACEGQTLARVLDYRQPALRTLSPRIPVCLSDLVDQMLEKDPALRPQTAAEVLVRLRGIAQA